MLNELNNKIGTLEEKIDKIETLEEKIGTLEEKISSNGQYLLSTGTAQIDGAVVRLCECKIYEYEVTKHLLGVVFNTSDISN